MHDHPEHHLLTTYRNQIDWLIALAEEFESGAHRIVGNVVGCEIDQTPHLAAECRYRAANMRAVLVAHERLSDRPGFRV